MRLLRVFFLLFGIFLLSFFSLSFAFWHPSDLGTVKPSQPKGPFPVRNFGGEKRRFSADLYYSFPWLEYSSILQDMPFLCSPIFQFLATGLGRSEKVFRVPKIGLFSSSSSLSSFFFFHSSYCLRFSMISPRRLWR